MVTLALWLSLISPGCQGTIPPNSSWRPASHKPRAPAFLRPAPAGSNLELESLSNVAEMWRKWDLMAFAHKVNRVTMSGSMFGGEEEWSTGFYMGNISADANAPQQSIVDAIGPLWQTLFTTAANGFSNAYKTHEIKIVSLKASDGKTVPDSQVYYTYPAPITGGYTSNTNPPQISAVATLISPIARGLASKGRMFLPGTGFGVDTNGRIPSTNQTALTNALKTFLTAVNALPEDNVILLSSKGRTAPLIGAPVMHEVTSIRIGNVYDTQRRRRNALTEVYTTATL